MPLRGSLEDNLVLTGKLTSIPKLAGNISKTLNLKASLSKLDSITVQLEPVDGYLTGSLSNTININSNLTKMDIIEGKLQTGMIPTGDVYTGEYSVRSLPFEDYTLDTKDKTMINDITVQQIPYYETTNLSGGYTVIIS